MNQSKKYLKYAYDEYMKNLKFFNAEKVLLSLIDIIYDNDELIDLYNLLINVFEIQEKDGSIDKYKLEIANCYIMKENLEESIFIYENIAEKYLNNKNKKYFVSKLVLKSGLCRIAYGDSVAINNGIYVNIFIENKTELKLLKDIVEIIENNKSIKDFTTIIRNFDEISKFDEYEVLLLLKIKKIIQPQIEL